MAVGTSSSGDRFQLKTSNHRELFDKVFDMIVTGDDVVLWRTANPILKYSKRLPGYSQVWSGVTFSIPFSRFQQRRFAWIWRHFWCHLFSSNSFRNSHLPSQLWNNGRFEKLMATLLTNDLSTLEFFYKKFFYKKLGLSFTKIKKFLRNCWGWNSWKFKQLRLKPS